MILRGWLQYYNSLNSLSRIVVDSNNATNSDKLFSSTFSETKFVDDLHRVSREGERSFWEQLKRGLRFFDDKQEDSPTFTRIRSDIQRVKMLHFLGGGYITSFWPSSAFLLGFSAAAKENTGVQLVGTGLGIGPLPAPPNDHAKEILRKSFAAFDFLEVRDHASLDALRDLSVDVKMGIDDTFIEDLQDEDRGYRTLHLSAFDPKGFADAIVSNALEIRSAQFDRILFWSCCPSHAENQCYNFAELALGGVEKLTLSQQFTLPLPIRAGDFFITDRFHPHLYGARSGASGYTLTRGSYYGPKHRSVTALGSTFGRYAGSGGMILERENSRIDNATLVRRKKRTADYICGSLDKP